MTKPLFPASGVIPTRNRVIALRATLKSLSKQSIQPEEIIIIDASDNEETKSLLLEEIKDLGSNLVYLRASTRGAAAQRNEGVAQARCPFILFMDDDLIFEEQCLQKLFSAIESDSGLGGVNAMITNQKYHRPGKISDWLYKFLNGKKLDSYAGKCLGPVMNLLPEDRADLPEVVPVEWLNTTCTIYRKEVLPDPTFPAFFIGYSLFEDVCLSVTVAKMSKLANARTARIYHDSQPGDHKENTFMLSKMELVNRYFVMTKVLGRSSANYHFKLIVLELHKILSYFSSAGKARQLPLALAGKFSGLLEIITK